jgi:hypothetical protein
MSEPLLRVPNHHAVACGNPPIVDGSDQNLYIGYFENDYGEQWIFTRDRTTGIATLRGGDIGWNTNIDETDGPAAALVLNQPERQWLESCLAASDRLGTSK